MRTRSPNIPKYPNRLLRYTFEINIEEIRISIKFPCKLTISWNHPQGTVRGTKIVPLLNGLAKLDQILTFSISLKTDDDKQLYESAKCIMQISLITESGTSLAGIVPINLQNHIERNNKEIYEIQRCPDKMASVKMRIINKFAGQKPSHRIDSIFSPDRDKGSSNQSEITLNRQRRADSIKTRDLMKEEMYSLKTKANDFQSRYRTQKSQNSKLNQIMKGKQEVYLSLKTEIKRRQIQIETLLRSLQQYKGQYSRIKIQNDILKKQKDRFQNLYEGIQKLSNERVSKVEFESSSYLKKIQKLVKQNQKLKSLNVSPLVSKQYIQPNNTSALTQTIKLLKKQKQDNVKQFRQQKQTYDKQIRQLKTLLIQKQQTYSQIKSKYESVVRKLSKLQQNRSEQFQKISKKMLELQKSKQTVNVELHVLKRDRSKKQLNNNQNIKSLQKQVSEQSINTMRLTQTLTDLQAQKIKLQKQLQFTKNSFKTVEDQKIKLDKEIQHLKYQITSLNELIFVKNNEIKQSLEVNKTFQQSLKKRQQELEEEYNIQKQQLQLQIQQVRRSQESKYIALTGVLIKKQMDFEGVTTRDQKMQMTIQNLQQQNNKLQGQLRQKVHEHKSREQSLKYQFNQTMRKRGEYQLQLTDKMKQLQLQIQGLNNALMIAKQNEFKFLQRQQDNRLQLQQLKQMYSSVNIHVLQLKQQLDDYHDIIQNGRRNQAQMSAQISQIQSKHSKMVTQFKQKMVQLQGQKLKLIALLKQKQKSTNQSVQILKQQVEQLRKDLLKRQTQLKKSHDQNRQILNKQKIHSDNLEMQVDRLTNQYTRTNSLVQRNKIYIEQLQSQIRGHKQTIKNVCLQKQQLQHLQSQIQQLNAEIDELKTRQMTVVGSKQRQIKTLKLKIEQIDSEMKEFKLLRSRMIIVLEEVYEIVSRLGGNKIQSITGEYQKIMEIRKGLFSIQTRLIKQTQRTSDHERLTHEIENIKAELQKLQYEKAQFRLKESEYRRSQELLKRQIQNLNHNNEQLLAQLNHSSISSGSSIKDNSTILMSQINQFKLNQQQHQNEIRKIIDKYERLLQEVRIQTQEKIDKTKKQFVGTNKSLQNKIQQLQHKLFTLQIQNQRLPQLSKKDEQIKRLTNKVFSLQRQIIQLSQTTFKQPETKVNRIQQNLKLKYQRQINTLTIQNQRLNNKVRQLHSQNKQKQSQIQKSKLSIQSIKQQFNYQKTVLEQQKIYNTQTENKLRLEIQRLRTQLSMIKKIHSQSKNKLLDLQSSNNIDLQLQNKQHHIKQLQQSNTKLNQQVFRLNQKLQQTKWEIEQTVLAKDNEIMIMQQQLYNINSKQNMRILKQAEYIERIRALENQKNQLINKLQQTSSRIGLQNQSIRQLQNIIHQQQSSIDIAVENEKKYEQIIQSFRHN